MAHRGSSQSIARKTEPFRFPAKRGAVRRAPTKDADMPQRKQIEKRVEMAAGLCAATDERDRFRILAGEMLRRDGTERGRPHFGNPCAVHDRNRVGRCTVEQGDGESNRIHPAMRIRRVHAERLDGHEGRVFRNGQCGHEKHVVDRAEQALGRIQDPRRIALPAQMLDLVDRLGRRQAERFHVGPVEIKNIAIAGQGGVTD